LVILTVVLPIFVAVLGQALVQRLVPSARRQEHNDVAGFIYAVLGVAYAVLLAFVAIVVWEDYETAESTMESEANELARIYFPPTGSPNPTRSGSMIWPAPTPGSSWRRSGP
jgi:hypothetical protein